jgi:hypothetical protein
MPMSDGGGTYKRPKAKKKKTPATKPKSAAKPKAASAPKKLTPEQFARNQLRKAGIKPTGGDVAAQFRKLNAVAAKQRAKAGLGRAAAVGASSALAAGKRRAKRKAKK